MIEKRASIECAEFEEVLHDLDRPGTVGFFIRETAFAHAESCGECALLLIRNESLDLALRAIAAPHSERLASPQVETALMKEFRRTKAAPLRLRVKWQAAALGVAAAILLVLGFSLHRFSPVQKTPVAVQSLANPAASQRAPVSSAALDVQNGSGELVADSSAFIPLPYADDPAAVQDDAVVRVALSPAALASLGLPVAETDSSETVSADLKVSEDGTPQAIRLVSRENSEESF